MYENRKKILFKTAGLILLLLSAAFMFSCASGAESRGEQYGDLGRATDPIPFMAAARTGTLPNGLSYYILENSKPEGRAYLTLAVNAGSVLEKEDEQGLAHFVEHMAFNGTERFPEAELIDYLRSLGMRFGPEVNAYTSYDETVYGIEVPVETGSDGIKRIPEKALFVIDDWTYAITFAPADVDDERLVIMEEYRTRLGANERIRRIMLPILFEGSPYAERQPIGLPEIIQNAPAERLEHFYKTWYRPDNMALIFVGDFDGEALEKELSAYFTMPAPKGKLSRPVYDLPAPEAGKFRAEIITDPELSYPRIDMYYKRVPQPLTADIASYRQGVINTLIGRMLSLRFDEAASKPETPYIAAAGQNLRYGHSSRYYVLSVIPKTGAAESAFAEILREKESVERYGFTADEIDRTKRSLVSDLERMVSEKDRQESSSYVNDFTYHFLKGQGVPDIEWELDAVKKLLPGIGKAEVDKAAADYFSADELLIFVTAPDAEKASLPGADRIREMVVSAAAMDIAPPESAAVPDQLLPDLPRAGTIISEIRDQDSGTLTWNLSNGARVILKETANKNNEIVLYALAKGGTGNASAEADISASLASEMMEVSGLGPYTRTELMKMLSDKQVSLGLWLSAYLRGFQGAATAGDIETLFELLYLNFTEPRIDEKAVAAMMDQYRTLLAQRSENPETVFSDEVTRTVYGDNPRFMPMTAEDLPRVSPADARAFLSACLSPGDYTFVFTGNLNIENMRTLTETYLASIPEGQSLNEWADLGVRRPGKTEKTVYKGREEKGLVFMGWYVPETYTDADGAIVSVLNEYLDIKLTQEIRESLGGVYSVSVSVSLTPVPAGELAMGISFSCDPGRADELAAAIENEVEAVAAGTIDGATLEKAIAALKKNFEQSMQSNTYIARNYANYSTIMKLPLGRLEARPSLYEQASPAALREKASALMAGGPVRVTLYPEGR